MKYLPDMRTSLNRKVSPRQRMINLMYLVFIALLALNISSGALDGFNHLNESLSYTTEEIKSNNSRTAAELYKNYILTDDSVFSYIPLIQTKTDSLYNYIESVKNRIVLLGTIRSESSRLKGAIDEYNDFLSSLFFNYIPFLKIEKILSPEWETLLFNNCDGAVSISLLAKLQLDIRQTESSLLHQIEINMGAKGLSASGLKACVVPDKQTLLSGEDFKGKIVLYRENNQNLRNVFILNRQISLKDKNEFSLIPDSPGIYQIEGYAELVTDSINSSILPFRTSYSVTNPVLTVASVRMNVLYAGYPNELRIAIPGVPTELLHVSATRGNLIRKKNNDWELIPATPGEQLHLIVSYPWREGFKKDSVLFRVIRLPDPAAFLKNAGGNSFKGGTIRKQQLLGYEKLEAGYEDNLLDARFEILSFDVAWFDSFGNQLRERTTGSWLSDRQKAVLKAFPAGKAFYFSAIQVKGDDGIIRTISPIEAIIN